MSVYKVLSWASSNISTLRKEEHLRVNSTVAQRDRLKKHCISINFHHIATMEVEVEHTCTSSGVGQPSSPAPAFHQ